MCYCDNDASVYDEKVRVARKEHSCYECSKKIQKGDKYLYCHGVWDGRGDDFKMCHDCATIYNLAYSLTDCFCFTFGNLRYDVQEVLRWEK